MATFVECVEGGTPCFVNMDTVTRINIDIANNLVVVRFTNGDTRTFDDVKSIRAITMALDILRPSRE